jgi:hypothetical protein
MRIFLLVAFIALFAVAFAQRSLASLQQDNKFDPKVFAKCLADKLGVTLDKAVGCALDCKLDFKCYPKCLGIDDKKKVIVAAIECALASKTEEEVEALL